MQYQNVSNRTIRVVNVIMKPNNIASFPENLSHVKTFLKMGWLACVGEDPKEEPRKAPVKEAPVPVVVAEEVPVVVAEEVPAVVVTEEASVVSEEAPVVAEEAPVVVEDSDHKRGRGRKGK